MTNDEVKKKIINILTETLRWEPYYFISRGIVYEIADALIAAGIGDVKATEHRAEVAEKLASARKEAVKEFANTLASKIPCHSYYYGDSIVSAIYVLAGGREIKNVKPVNISEFHTQELERKLKEAEHRAEVAERALKECSKRLSVFTKYSETERRKKKYITK